MANIQVIVEGKENPRKLYAISGEGVFGSSHTVVVAFNKGEARRRTRKALSENGIHDAVIWHITEITTNEPVVLSNGDY